MEDLRGRWVHFRIVDVHVPDPVEILRALHGDDLLQGRVVALSDTGLPGGQYAVVEVEGLDRPLVVATPLLEESF